MNYYQRKSITMQYLSGNTGWSTATAIFQIFLTGTKKLKNHITQCFLSTLYTDILIFWCFSVVRLKKLCLSGLCHSSVNSPILKGRRTQIPPKHIPSPYISMNTTQIPIDTPTPSPRHPSLTPRHLQGTQEVNRWKQTSTDIKRHPQTPLDTVRCLLRKSGGVCWGMLLSVDILTSLEMPGGYLGGYLSGIQRNGGAQMCLRGNWVLRPCSMKL